MPSNPCRWGILGTANIARKNWKAMRLAGNSVLTHVASRDPARAAKFIAECQSDVSFPQVPAACTYEEMITSKDIDAIYIPLPTGIRPDWVIQAANNGKHVLCEKPCATNARELRTMVEACQTNRVQFMDGVMFMHSKRLPLLRQSLDNASRFGSLRRVTSQFSFLASPEFHQSNIRTHSTLEPLGCLGDLGWYNIRLSLWAMKYQMPEKATGRIHTAFGREGAPVPMEFSGELQYANGVTASYFCSFEAENQQWAHFSGTLGSIRMQDFVLPFYGSESAFEWDKPVFDVAGCSFHMQSHPERVAAREYSDGMPDSQETNMIRNFSDLVLKKTLDASWPEIALKTQIVMDACLESAHKGSVPVAI